MAITVFQMTEPTVSQVAVAFAGAAFLWFAHAFNKTHNVIVKYFNGGDDSIPMRLKKLEKKVHDDSTEQAIWRTELRDSMERRGNDLQTVMHDLEKKIDGAIERRRQHRG